MKVVTPGPTAGSYGFAHLDPYLSVSDPVGFGESKRGNRKLDVMLVQYFLLVLGTRVNPGQGDEYVDQFFILQREKGFAVDGKFGGLTRDAIMLYQSYAAASPISGSGTITGREMKLDLVVSPGPEGKLPINAQGKIYAIAHMNERFKVMHPEFTGFIRTDGTAPPDLRKEIAKLFPGPAPQPLPGSAPATILSIPSYHISRARHFPPRR